jgi:ComF family protein
MMFDWVIGELPNFYITKLSNVTVEVRALIQTITAPFLDFIFPPVCISCKRLLADGSIRVCKECWNSIERVTRVHPLFIETREKLIAEGAVSDLVSQFVFAKEGVFQHIAHALKYDGNESVGRELGRKIGQTMVEWGVQTDVLIPIPLHKVKQRERGYNQSELIARGIEDVTGIVLCRDAVRRRKHTQTQTQLDLEGRRKNVEGAFEVKPSAFRAIEGRTCLLVDDVITTGSTIQACARELMGAGAAKVIAASAALAR